jgi:hypothetical protein
LNPATWRTRIPNIIVERLQSYCIKNRTSPFASISSTFEFIFKPFTNARCRSAAEEPTGTIVAGTGSDETRFCVPQSALEKSPVIKGWIEDKESIPTSLQKDDALYFPECDPQVVHATVDYLKSTTTGLIAIPDPSTGSKDALFYVKVYKFALCLG